MPRTDDDDNELDRDDLALIGKLRALPLEGTEPDWAVLEQQIRAAVPATVPRAWWRKHVAWLVPAAGVFVAATAITILVVRKPQIAEPVMHDAGVSLPVAAHDVPRPGGEQALWLDGQVVDVDEIDPQFLDDRDDNTPVGPPIAAGSMLPGNDLQWLDSLDDQSLDRVEAWLEKKKKS